MPTIVEQSSILDVQTHVSPLSPSPFVTQVAPEVDVRIEVEPVNSTLAAMALLTQEAPDSQVEPWLEQVRESLTAAQRRTNHLVFAGLGPALLLDEPASAFAEYLDALQAQSPADMRQRLPDDAGHLVPDAALRDDVQALLDDPAQLHETVVSHLRSLWALEFEAEWQGKANLVESAASKLQERAWSCPTAHEVLRTFYGHDLPDSISLQLAGVHTIAVAPTPHIRRHVARFGDAATLWLFVPADFTTLSLRARPIQRGEVLGPLRALADDTRLQILELLVAHESLLAQEIITHLDVGQSTVSRHLKQLGAAGLVMEQRAGDANKSYQFVADRLQEICWVLCQLLSPTNALAIRSDARRSMPQILQRFVNREGLVTLWPRGAQDRQEILAYLVAKFKRNQLYSEEQVNDVLNEWHTFEDAAHLRRQLVDHGYLDRTSSGDRYWRER